MNNYQVDKWQKKEIRWDQRYTGVVQVGDAFKLELESMQFWVFEKRCQLNPQQTKLMAYFMRHPDKVIPRNQIKHELWGSANVTDNRVGTLLADIREAIEPNPAIPQILVNYMPYSKNPGYIFVSDPGKED